MKRLMKGEAVSSLTQVRFPVAVSPKIDGFRCWLDSQPLTTRLRPFQNPVFGRQLGELAVDKVGLDGEVVVGKRRGPGVLSRTSSGVTKRGAEPDWRFWVFDCIEDGDLSVPFKTRLFRAREIVRQINDDRVRFMKHKVIHNYKDLVQFADGCIDLGFEGIMGRSLDGPYKEGRATLREGHLWKWKPFVEAEGEVIGYYEEEENTNEAVREANGKLKRSSAKAGKVPKGTLGGLILRDLKTNVEVRVGGGFSDLEREALWKVRHKLKGKIVTYKKQMMGEKDKPRSPQFLKFRFDWDYTAEY